MSYAFEIQQQVMQWVMFLTNEFEVTLQYEIIELVTKVKFKEK